MRGERGPASRVPPPCTPRPLPCVAPRSPPPLTPCGAATAPPQDGGTALMFAADSILWGSEHDHGKLGCLEHLIANGAELEATDKVSAAPPAASGPLALHRRRPPPLLPRPSPPPLTACGAAAAPP